MSSVKIIAEAGVNHNGEIGKAMALVDAAVAAGASAVKFQTFRADLQATEQAKKAAYQCQNTPGDESQLDMIRQLELSQAEFVQLSQHCEASGIDFLSTAFDTPSLVFLHETLNVSTFKIASGELTNTPLLLEHARRAEALIVSTGMATLDEVERALGVIAYGMCQTDGREAMPTEAAFADAYSRAMQSGALNGRVTLLHCTTEYPAPLDQINLRAMHTLRQQFKLPVGYSDHTLGHTVPIAAVALGATVIEKHFTLDKRLPGPDHAMSLNPEELTSMVRLIHDTRCALGDGQKVPGVAESANRDLVRKSLVAARPIAPGELFSAENLCVKRPGTGVPPSAYWRYLGTIADRAYQPNEFIR